jgi:SAM-dependent methyltransferase
MHLWDFKSFLYHGARRLPGIGWILDAEMRNLRRLADRVSPWPEPAADVGTGAGSTLDILPPSVRPVCMDRSVSMIRRAIRRRPMLAVAGDLRRLPFRKGRIGFLSAVGVTEYLPEPEAFLAEAAAVLRAGGTLLVTVSPGGFLTALRNGLGHRVRPVRPASWEESLRRAGFTILDREQSLFQIQYLAQKTERRR